MPTDIAWLGVPLPIQWRERNVFHALGLKMNFAAVIPRKPLDEFRNDALSPVPAIKELRNDGNAHFITSGSRSQFRLGPNSVD